MSVVGPAQMFITSVRDSRKGQSFLRVIFIIMICHSKINASLLSKTINQLKCN